MPPSWSSVHVHGHCRTIGPPSSLPAAPSGRHATWLTICVDLSPGLVSGRCGGGGAAEPHLTSNTPSSALSLSHPPRGPDINWGWAQRCHPGPSHPVGLTTSAPPRHRSTMSVRLMGSSDQASQASQAFSWPQWTPTPRRATRIGGMVADVDEIHRALGHCSSSPSVISEPTETRERRGDSPPWIPGHIVVDGEERRWENQSNDPRGAPSGWPRRE